MNATERNKAFALGFVAPGGPHADWERRMIRTLRFIARREAHKPLTPKQKFQLDSLIYRYRVQLSGRIWPFDLPDQPPIEEDYVPLETVEQMTLL